MHFKEVCTTCGTVIRQCRCPGIKKIVEKVCDSCSVDDSKTGFDRAPTRYMAQGRETIDRIRDELGDAGFIAFCKGNEIKYTDRAGLKRGSDKETCFRKAYWYAAMWHHVRDPKNCKDPRWGRKDFVPYERPGLTCPGCGAKEVEAMTPRTVYACGSSDYDQRPGTFTASCQVHSAT